MSAHAQVAGGFTAPRRIAVIARPTLVSWMLLGGFFALQVAIILSELTGPFVDESIYIAAGRRTLEGHGVGDYYLTWFAGSLLWPTIAGAADAVGGLNGARIAAAVCVTLGIWGAVRASASFFGDAVRPWTAVAALLCGAIVQLGHLAVYDALAFGALGMALAAVAELARTGERGWVILAALALAVAGLAKYPVLVFGGVPLVALILTTRRRRGLFDVAVLAFIVAAVLLVFFLPFRNQLAEFLQFRTVNNPSFGVTTAMVGYQYVYFLAVPFALALVGWACATGQRQATAPLLLGPLMPAIYHLGSHTAVGLEKHAAIAALPALPLAGKALAQAWDRRWIARGALVASLAGLLAFSALQVTRLDRSWLDVRPAVTYMEQHVRPGQFVLADTSWPYIQYLYPSQIHSPADVYDIYRMRNDPPPGGACSATWYVVSSGASSWPSAVRDQIAGCRTFRPVYTEAAHTDIGLSSGLRFFHFPESVTIYRNSKVTR